MSYNTDNNKNLSSLYILTKTLLWKPKIYKLHLKYKLIKYLIKYESLDELIREIETNSNINLNINEITILNFMEENKR